MSSAESVSDLCSVFNIPVCKYIFFVFFNICSTNLPIYYDNL